MRSPLPRSAETIRKHSFWFIIYGVVLILLGIFAIIAPGVATLAAELLLGWLLIIGGIVGLIAIIRGGSGEPGFWWNLLISIVFILAGASLLWQPIVGMLTLTIVLAAYFIATGIFKIPVALRYRRADEKGWGWMLFSALLDLVLGVAIILGLPGTAIWVLGLLVGINFLFTGVAILMIALAMRRWRKQGPRTANRV
ncbi:MAG TPA: DUF308 domain-containing protein [Kiloniellales bacterium]|nr:DUF308 domain-containing protein [Kiloniellales bacterium]